MEDGVFFEATQAEPLEGHGQTRAERRDQQIQRILEAAQACFVRSGFQGASMQQICAECGMSPGALFPLQGSDRRGDLRGGPRGRHDLLRRLPPRDICPRRAG
jgi:hypothetical protein